MGADYHGYFDLAEKAALDVLKPSKKDLERGLELHKNSVVFDSYGFSPSSAFYGDILDRLVSEGAGKEEFTDASEEMSMVRHVYDQESRREYLEAWERSGVTCVFQNAGVEHSDPMQIIKRFSRFSFVTQRLADKVSRAYTPDDIEAAKKAGRNCLYFTTNAVPVPPALPDVRSALAYIRIFFQLGCRMMHLTYNRRNMIGDGCAEKTDSGLSDFGVEAVREMCRAGVIPDGAHSGQQTCVDAAKVASKPVVVSHSACRALHESIRGKDDATIKAVAESGGYIGICCIPDFLGGSRDLNALLDHIDYAAKKFGPDHVAIGTDHGYGSRSGDEEGKKIRNYPKFRAIWDQFWPPNCFTHSDPNSRENLSLSWLNWKYFTVGLAQRGWSDGDIRKIIGGNVMRVARQALEGSSHDSPSF